MIDDNSALELLKKGDKKAFRYFFDMYYNRLVAFIMTYTDDKMKSEDIVQQVFVLIWNDRDKLVNIRNPKSYFYKIAYNRYLDGVKKEKRRTKLLELAYEKALRDRIEEDNEALKSRIKKLNAIIEALPKRCRQILKMSKVEGFKYADIADILGISEKTVENQIGIAFKKIRKAFEDDNIVLFFSQLLKRI